MLDADVLYACDRGWWDLYIRDVRNRFQGELWTINNAASMELKLNRILGATRQAAGRRLLPVFGLTSGHQAICVAKVFGAARVTLLAYDMCRGVNGEVHHHGNHPKPLGNGGDFTLWRANMTQLAQNIGIPVCNASAQSALTCFPRMNLAEALAS